VVKEGTDTICGSCVTALTNLKNLVRVVGLSLEAAVEACATSPARICNLPTIGDIKVGKRADFVFIDKNLELMTTIINGNVVYEANEY
jgi:N-acetylglucosamine-6-phosphate deacetylase